MGIGAALIWLVLGLGDEASLHRTQLEAPSVAIRRAAALALAEDPSPETLRALERALGSDGDPLVRARCAWSLAALRRAESLPALAAAAEGDADEGVRAWAAFAIGRISTASAAPAATAPSAMAPAATAPSAMAPSAMAPAATAPSVIAPSATAPATTGSLAQRPRLTAPAARLPIGWAYLRGLSGLEVSYFGGRASVDTSYRDASGQAREVARGSASSSGYRLAFYGLPGSSGFFFYPSLGYVSQRIALADFRQHIPSFAVAHATTIPAVASDPRTGAAVDPEAPNVYTLEVRSLYLGQRLGVTKVWQRPWLRAALSLEGIVNLVEWRDLQYRIADYDSRTAPDVKDTTSRWVGLDSGGVTAGLALGFLDLHLALRGELKYEVFRHFEFPKAVEFRGPVRFNPEIANFERERLFLSGVDYHSVDGKVSVSLFF